MAEALAELHRLRGGLVVSCQAPPESPLHGPPMMAAMAQAAMRGGAAGIRANGVADIAAIRAVVTAPILGILKVPNNGGVFITPTGETARAVITAGTRLVALDGTMRPRPGSESLSAVIAAIHAAGGAALADVATMRDGEYALACGADAVGTTLSGYTPDSPWQDEPDFDLLRALVAQSSVPVFAEGRFWTREQARAAINLGASFVVIGTAITNPIAITERFVAAMAAKHVAERAT